MVNVSQDMFADGHAVATAALKGDTMPAAAMNPKSLAAGSATSILAALDPDLSCKSYFITPTKDFEHSFFILSCIIYFRLLTYTFTPHSAQRCLPCRRSNLEGAPSRTRGRVRQG